MNGVNEQHGAGLQGRRVFGDLTMPGRSSFDWAVFFAAAALIFPVSGLIGVVFADRSRRKGYARWKAALAVAIWCMFLGAVLRGLLKVGVFP
jgi:hypothetical protein